MLHEALHPIIDRHFTAAQLLRDRNRRAMLTFQQDRLAAQAKTWRRTVLGTLLKGQRLSGSRFDYFDLGHNTDSLTHFGTTTYGDRLELGNPALTNPVR